MYICRPHSVILLFSSLSIQLLWLFQSFSRTSLPHCSFSTLLLVELDTLFNCTYQYFAVRDHIVLSVLLLRSIHFHIKPHSSLKMQLPTKTLLALLPFILQAEAFASGTGTTTRYWDCCKPSCAWPGKAELASGSNPVTTCDIKDNPLTDYNTGM